MNLLRKFLGQVLGLLAALLLFAMMTLTFVDVIGRYLFNSPVHGGFEMTEMMLATLIFLGLPLITADRGHVCVDLFDAVVPRVVRPAQMVLVDLLSTVAMGVMTWQIWLLAVRTHGYGDTTALLQIPFAPLVYLMTVMSAATTLILAGMVVADGIGIFSPRRRQNEHE